MSPAKERVVDELITEHAIHQVVHCFEGGRFRRELRCYPLHPDEVSVIEITADEERERVVTFAACRKLKEVAG